MNINSIYLQTDSSFAKYISEWAEKNGVQVVNYDPKSEDIPEGLLLVNENQDVEKLHDEIHGLFDAKHIPTQRIDLNGTLQVAVTNMKMWLANYKCKNILMLGSDALLKNDNLDRFFARISE